MIREALSRRILLPAGRLRRMVHPARRQAEAAYAGGVAERAALNNLGPEQRHEWVLKRVRVVVRHAAAEIPYYHELFNRTGFDPAADFTFADFAKLPVLERDDIRNAGKDLISIQIPPELLVKDATGGSTGTPTEVWLGPEEIGWRERALEDSMQPIGGWFDCFRLSPEVFEKYRREFEEWKPACIVAYASAAGHLAEYILERGYKPNYPTRCFVTGAEKLLPAQRTAIVEAFKRPVHERYGSRDVGLMAFQYDPEHTLEFETDWTNILVEPETTDPLSSILITKLHADGMPMLRYRIGDVARFAEGSRPGHPAFVLREIVGREGARLWLRDGRWVMSEELPHLLKDFPVREFMCVQRADYSVQLQIVPRNGFSEENKQRILDTIGVNLPGLELSIAIVEEIQRTAANKWQPVVSEVRRQMD